MDEREKEALESKKETVEIIEEIDSFTNSEDGGDSAEMPPAKGWQVSKSVLIRIAALVVIAAGMFAYVKYTDTTYIMVFDGRKVSAEEFKLFYYLGQDIDADSALQVLIDYSVIEMAAKKNAIELTEEEKLDVTSYASYLQEFIETIGVEKPRISYKRLEEILSVDYLYPKLAEVATQDVIIDETELRTDAAVEWENYKANFGGGEMDDDFVEAYREYIIQVKKYEYFEEMIEIWKTEANIKVNDKVFERLAVRP